MIKENLNIIQIMEVNNIKYCVNTHITNKIVEESLKKLIGDLQEFDILKPEKKFGLNTRFDFLLFNFKKDKKAFLEVKSVSLSRKLGHAEFDQLPVEGRNIWEVS